MIELQLISGSIADLKWFQEHSSIIQNEHSGEFVAIKDKKIVESDLSALALLKKLEKKGKDNNSILIKHVVPRNEIVIL